VKARTCRNRGGGERGTKKRRCKSQSFNPLKGPRGKRLFKKCDYEPETRTDERRATERLYKKPNLHYFMKGGLAIGRDRKKKNPRTTKTNAPRVFGGAGREILHLFHPKGKLNKWPYRKK